MVEDFELFHNDPVGWFFVFALVADSHFAGDGVVNEYRADEAQAVIAVGNGSRVHQVRGGADGDGEN